MLFVIDSATSTASLAVYDRSAQQLLAEWTWQARRRHTQDLLPAAQQLFAQTSLTPDQITALAVTTGPGGFTGVRIGISTVKGLALGLSVAPQVIGVPTLNATAAPWLEATAALPGVQICAYMQAGRGRYTWAYLSAQEPFRRLTTEDHHAGAVDEFAADVSAQRQQTLLVGELSSELAAAMRGLQQVTVLSAATAWRRGGQLAQLAARLLDAGQQDSLTDLQPIYLRAP